MPADFLQTLYSFRWLEIGSHESQQMYYLLDLIWQAIVSDLISINFGSNLIKYW